MSTWLVVIVTLNAFGHPIYRTPFPPNAFHTQAACVHAVNFYLAHHKAPQAWMCVQSEED